MRSTYLASLLVLATAVAAQQPTLRCLSDVGVYVREHTLLSPPLEVLKFIPASTPITSPTVVTASQLNGSATTRITPTVSPKTATFVFQEQAIINGLIHYTWNYAGTATKTANQPHSWLLKVPANPAGNTLMVDVEPLSTYQVGTAQIDIGNDTSLEIDHKTTGGKLSRTFKLGTGAVDVRIVTLMYLVGQYGNADSDFRVALTLNPDTPVKVSSYGSMCGMKTTMSGTITAAGHRLTARIEGAFPKHGTMLLLGTQPASVPFPGTPCTILVRPLVSAILPDDSNGTIDFILDVPGRVDGVFYLQAVSVYEAFGYTSFRTSNGVKVDAN